MNEEVKTNLTKEELKEKLKSKINKFYYSWNKILTKEERELLIEFTSFLPNDISLVERKYYLVNDLNEIQKCPVCGKKVEYSKTNRKLNVFCSKECQNSKDGKEILNERQRERWRNKSNEEKEEISKLHRDIMNNMSEKKKKEKIKKYKESMSKRTDDEKEKSEIKRQNTCFEIYNVSNPMKSKLIKDLREENSLKKSDVKNPAQRKCVREKMSVTHKNRSKNKKKLIKEHQRNSWLNSLGVSHPSKNKKCKEKWLKSRRMNYFNTFIESIGKKDLTPLFLIDDYINAKHGDILKFKCSKCGKEFEYNIKKGNKVNVCDIHCPNPLHKLNFHSSQEQEIYEWLYKNNELGNIEQNKRFSFNNQRYEADIFLPDYNIAIEYNGLYWHSNLYRDKNYHYNKWKFFKEQNIDCIQIFENEWRDNKEVVKNIISDKLNLLQPLNETDYHLDSVDDKEFNSFMQQNSLFDCVDSNNKLGIYTSNKELIQVLSYTISDDKILIDNFCTKLGIKFDKGLVAFTNYLKQTYNKDIYIEIDCRYYSDKEFEGFEFVEHTEPNCYYFKKNNLYENKIDDDCLSIYDCGNDILVF